MKPKSTLKPSGCRVRCLKIILTSKLCLPVASLKAEQVTFNQHVLNYVPLGRKMASNSEIGFLVSKETVVLRPTVINVP